MERCRSGRTGRSRKPLSSLRGTEGSNPSLSAIPPFLAVSACRKTPFKAPVFGHISFPIVSRRMLLSPPEWGNDMGNGEPLPYPSPGYRKRGSAMAQIGKLSAVEVAKAKGPAVLHDGGGLYLRVA